MSPTGRTFLVWSRVEGHSRELDFFRTPTVVGAAAVRTGHLVPGVGGELTWLPGERVLHVWGCGTSCQGVRVYGRNGKVLFDADGMLHEHAKDGSVATTIYGGIVRFFDATTGRTMVFAGDPRAGTPLDLRVEGSQHVSVRFTDARDEADDARRVDVKCTATRDVLACRTTVRP